MVIETTYDEPAPVLGTDSGALSPSREAGAGSLPRGAHPAADVAAASSERRSPYRGSQGASGLALGDLLGRPWEAMPCDALVRVVLTRIGRCLPPDALPSAPGGVWERAAVAPHEAPWRLVSRRMVLRTVGDVVLTEAADGALHLSTVIAPGEVVTSDCPHGVHVCGARHLLRSGARLVGVYRLREEAE